MAGTRITFQIEGLPENASDITIEAFTKGLAQFHKALNATEQSVQPRKRRGSNITYRVVDLSHSSPATVVLEGFGAHSTTNVDVVVGTFIDSLQKVRAGQVESVNTNVIDAIDALAAGVGKDFSKILVRNGVSESTVAIDREMSAALRSVETQESRSYGSARGHVERYINHGDNSYFTLYPRVGSQLRCDFPPELVEQASAAVEQYVVVEGLMHYRPGHDFPYRCAAKEIEILPDDNDLPILQVGRFPSITGEATTSDYLEEIRDGWA